MRAKRRGRPVCFVLTAGQRHEAAQAEALLERGVVKRPGRGRPRVRPDRIAGDRGDTGRRLRRSRRRRGSGAVIPRQKTEPRRGVRFDRAAYRERNAVECTINRLKRYRAVATRDDKLQEAYRALVTLAHILCWL